MDGQYDEFGTFIGKIDEDEESDDGDESDDDMGQLLPI
eukprot:gene14915-43227_t